METEFTRWVSEEIDNRGWSIRELARRAGITHSALSIVLAGERKPSWDLCVAIARPLGESVESMFRRAGLLPPLAKPGDDLTLAELMDVAGRLSPEERQSLLEYALWRLRQEQRKKRGSGPETRPGVASEGATS